MRRTEVATAAPLPQAADLLFPVPFDTPEQRVADVPGLPRIAAANAAQEALVVPVAAGETIAFEDGLAPFPDAIRTPAGGAHETPLADLLALVASLAPADLAPADLAALWPLVAGNPALALGLADRGRIAPGLRAGLVLIDCPDGGTPAVRTTFVAGRVACGALGAG